MQRRKRFEYFRTIAPWSPAVVVALSLTLTRLQAAELEVFHASILLDVFYISRAISVFVARLSGGR